MLTGMLTGSCVLLPNMPVPKSMVDLNNYKKDSKLYSQLLVFITLDIVYFLDWIVPCSQEDRGWNRCLFSHLSVRLPECGYLYIQILFGGYWSGITTIQTALQLCKEQVHPRYPSLISRAFFPGRIFDICTVLPSLSLPNYTLPHSQQEVSSPVPPTTSTHSTHHEANQKEVLETLFSHIQWKPKSIPFLLLLLCVVDVLMYNINCDITKPYIYTSSNLQGGTDINLSSMRNVYLKDIRPITLLKRVKIHDYANALNTLVTYLYERYSSSLCNQRR